MANESIFEFADKFGYESPFGDWKPTITGGSFDPPKIVNAYIEKAEIVVKQNVKRDNSVTPITVFISVSSVPDKVEVNLLGKIQTATLSLPKESKSTIAKDNIPNVNKISDRIRLYKTNFSLITLPNETIEYSFTIKVYDLKEKNKVTDTKILTVSLNSNGDIKFLGLFDNKIDIKFIELQKSGEIYPKKIKEYRDFINKNIVSNQKKIWYLELQKHVIYRSQRDNENPKADVMCNLTTLAMNLEYLGIECPNSKIQFEDWLENRRIQKKYPERTNSQSWIKLASEFNIFSKHIDLTGKSLSEDKLKQLFNDKLSNFLEEGCAISLSIFPVCKGHIVRLQSITENGLIVDDPFGMVNNFKERNDCGSGYKNTKNSKDSSIIFGKDNLWKWNDIKVTQFRYAIIFSENKI